MSSQPLIKVEALDKAYDDTLVLNQVTMEVNQGETIALIGPSGCGKSTFLNIIGLLDNKTSGHYYLKGEDVTHYSKTRQAIIRNKMFGYVFQHFYLIQHLSIFDNIALPLVYRDEAKSVIEEAVYPLLEKLEIASLANRLPNTLSGGQQQRAAIARAMVGKPEIILADEPTGSLDPKTANKIKTLLFDACATLNSTLLMVTHDLSMANCCQRKLEFSQGSLI